MNDGMRLPFENERSWPVQPLWTVFAPIARLADTSLPVLSVSIHSGISDKELSNEERERNVWLSEDRSKYQKVVPGDLVYNSMRAWQGGFGACQTLGLVSPAYGVLSPISTINTKFYELLFRTKGYIALFDTFSPGIIDFRKRLSWDRCKHMKVPVPPLEEQNRIVKYACNVGDKVHLVTQKLQQQLDLLNEYRQSLITRAVTKGKNSKGFDAVSYVPFSAIFSLRRGLNITRENYQEEGVPCLSYGDVHSRYLGFVDAEINPLPKVSDDFVLTNPRCLLKSGEFVFADTSEDYKGSGDCTCVMNSGDGIFAGYHTTVASPTKRNICSQYYGYYFLSDDFRDQVRKEVKGVKVFSITNTILNHTKVLFPPLKDQEEIARFLDVKCGECQVIFRRFCS